MVGMSENLSSESRYASGVALVNVVAAGNEAGTVLDAWFPAPSLTQTPDLSLADELDALVAAAVRLASTWDAALRLA